MCAPNSGSKFKLFKVDSKKIQQIAFAQLMQILQNRAKNEKLTGASPSSGSNFKAGRFNNSVIATGPDGTRPFWERLVEGLRHQLIFDPCDKFFVAVVEPRPSLSRRWPEGLRHQLFFDLSEEDLVGVVPRTVKKAAIAVVDPTSRTPLKVRLGPTQLPFETQYLR